MVGSDAAVPPASFPFRKIWREIYRKSTISVIPFLKPRAAPCTTTECACLKSSIFPIIVTIALLIEGQSTNGTIYGTIYIFPLTG